MNPSTYSEPTERRLRLLIADPDIAQRHHLRTTLEEIGYRVVRMVTDGIAAVEAARRLRPDVVIAEIALPCLSGIHVAEILKAEHIAPVIALTEVDDPHEIGRAAAAGIQSYLLKPVRVVSLEPAIEVVHAVWTTHLQRERHVQWMQNKENAREAIDRAKQMLMEEERLSEAEAYRFIQTRSMRSRRPMGVIAEAILVSRSVTRQTAAAGSHEAPSHLEQEIAR
ncbi:MAG: response regulator receiver and domain protein [Chthonomonadaceae bacterium]|nr:response regulator receiver and domain protein [Chthonomonadaceae bacterium]